MAGDADGRGGLCRAVLALMLGAGVAAGVPAGADDVTADSGAMLQLPAPRHDGTLAIERLIAARRSVREFSGAPLGLEELSQVLWAAQGITSDDGLRAAPSAGALYPLEVYVVAAVDSSTVRTYRYLPTVHALRVVVETDLRPRLAQAALGQPWVRDNGALLVFTAVPGRTQAKYGARAQRYVHIEVGHAAQNVWLQGLALGLAATVVGAFDDERVGEIMQLPAGEEALYLMPVGQPRAALSLGTHAAR